jgi:hypothetical protein
VMGAISPNTARGREGMRKVPYSRYSVKKSLSRKDLEQYRWLFRIILLQRSLRSKDLRKPVASDSSLFTGLFGPRAPDIGEVARISTEDGAWVGRAGSARGRGMAGPIWSPVPSLGLQRWSWPKPAKAPAEQPPGPARPATSRLWRTGETTPARTAAATLHIVGETTLLMQTHYRRKGFFRSAKCDTSAMHKQGIRHACNTCRLYKDAHQVAMRLVGHGRGAWR